MDGLNPYGMSREDWVMSNPTVIDYNHRHAQSSAPAPTSAASGDKSFEDLIKLQLLLSANQQLQPVTTATPKQEQITSFGTLRTSTAIPKDPLFVNNYNPFVEDVAEDMDISDEENTQIKAITAPPSLVKTPKREITSPLRESVEVKSGAAFYKGLILYIPPFNQLAHTYKGSPAMKMLYASFEFSFKLPIKIETKPKENASNMMDATVFFQNHIIATGTGFAPHVEASVRALELLSETCYTIQAKEDYFVKCKLVDAEKMKTLNLKKWEAVSEKYPKLVDITKDTHIQKTFAVFLDSHTTSGAFEDIVCCNLTRQDVNSIKSVVEFFQLTMLPCSVSTNLSKKQTPCIISIHKYTSAQKLLDILVESGGENDKFRLYPPDTFRDFYKLHPNYWDPALKKSNSQGDDEPKTTLDDEELQALIMKPYENIITELFEKHKSLPKVKKSSEEPLLRKAGDDFMKERLQIDMTKSKNVAPVERMQLLLKYMEQLQEYGSRVLTSGRQDMIRIYHNAIDNLRKDLDTCRKDIEKEQKSNRSGSKGSESGTNASRSSPSRRKASPRRRSKSPMKKSYRRNSRNRSISPKRRSRSYSPSKRHDKTLRSNSPRRRPRSRSPRRNNRSRSPRKPRSRSPRRLLRSPRRSLSPRKVRSPLRRGASPPRRGKSPRPSRSGPPVLSSEDENYISIFKDQFRRYVDILRRFRIEIEDMPIERRITLKEKLIKCQEQLVKFHNQAMERRPLLADYVDEMVICREELAEQADLIAGKPLPNDLPPDIAPPPWLNVRNFAPGPRPPVPRPQGFYAAENKPNFRFPF